MSDDINKMDFKHLRNEVQLLRDELALMKRKYEDILYNIDTDNFSSRFVKEQGDMRTAIEITAEGIKTKVSKDELQSEITQVADEIKLSVNALDEEVSSLSISTSGISSRVNNIEDGEFGGYTLFQQTGNKFKFSGNVEISGDTIVGGTLTGASLQNLGETTKLVLGHWTDSTVGDLHLYRIDVNGVETKIFSIEDNVPASIQFRALDDVFLRSSGDTTYLSGIWDFSDCDDVIFPDGVGGGSGGTAIAVFG